MAGPAETTLKQFTDLLPPPMRSVAEPTAWPDRNLEPRSLVDISPPEIVRRHSATWSGLYAETVQIMRHAPFEMDSVLHGICSSPLKLPSATTARPLLKGCLGLRFAISGTSSLLFLPGMTSADSRNRAH
jgi:hypothetical protein